MAERWSSGRKKLSVRVAVTAALVGTGVSVLGVVPALADDDDARTLNVRVDDRGRNKGGDDEHFRGTRGDVRYLWFRVCSLDDGLTGTTTTTTTTAPAASADATLTDGTSALTATDALDAALAGAADAGSTTDTTGTTGTTGTTESTTTDVTTEVTDPLVTNTVENGTTTSTVANGDEVADYPAFITIPQSRERAREIKAQLRALSREERKEVCYDLTSRSISGLETVAASTTTSSSVEPTTEVTVPTTTETSTETTTTENSAVAVVTVPGS